ncbi:hypothetical protein [Streptomyces mirabilis]|uniref:hypothetical protein n=1 Tax=Streptomyces mirabilis TaxID=68239 RepID=UPI00340DD94D
MTCETSATDVIACLFLAVGLFSTSLIPFFLLVNAEHLTPRFVRDLPVTVAALCMLLTAAPEATR